MSGIWDTILWLAAQPFVWGLLVGLAITFLVWNVGHGRRKQLRWELRKKTEDLDATHASLDRQMRANRAGYESLEKKIAELEDKNRNLQDTVSAYREKPGGQQRRELHIIDRALRKMNTRAPGFPAAWEEAYLEAEKEVDESESGLRKIVSRLVGGKTPRYALPQKDSDNGEQRLDRH